MVMFVEIIESWTGFPFMCNSSLYLVVLSVGYKQGSISSLNALIQDLLHRVLE